MKLILVNVPKSIFSLNQAQILFTELPLENVYIRFRLTSLTLRGSGKLSEIGFFSSFLRPRPAKATRQSFQFSSLFEISV